MPGECKFHDLWLKIEAYCDWHAHHPKHEGMAICALCSKDFDVSNSNMGEAALKSHATFEELFIHTFAIYHL
jgi:hypothetical protein